MELIDFHAHILPRADHGSDSVEVSVAQLELAKKYGVNKIIATPHFYPDKMTVDAFIKKRDTSYSVLLEQLPSGVELCLGAEVLICEGIFRLEGIEKLCINGTRVILAELPFGYISKDMPKTFSMLIKNGFTVVLAHADRYKASVINELIKLGCFVQLNVDSLVKPFAMRKYREWISQGSVVAIGSDIHGVNENAYKNYIKAVKLIGESFFGIATASSDIFEKSLSSKSVNLLCEITSKETGVDMNKIIAEVGDVFRLKGSYSSYEQLTNGNINTTYKVCYLKDGGAEKYYLFQRINTNVFKEPVAVMENIDKVTSHIRAKYPEKTVLHFHHTDAGENYYFDLNGACWRVENYIDSLTFNTCDSIDILRNTGAAFGDFQKALGDFDASELHEIIPDFHNTKKRLETLFEHARCDENGRVEKVRAELEFIKIHGDLCSRLTKLLDSGELPLRVTHNDTKINNVLFDKDTKEPIVVIDLDTVMPGLAAYDFGDAVRFAASNAKEDEEELKKVSLNLEKYRAFAEGFVGSMRDVLTEAELNTLALGAITITFELAARFLDDYITGDRYFKINYPEHNLVRARCQLKLAEDMLTKYEIMCKIIKNVYEKER